VPGEVKVTGTIDISVIPREGVESVEVLKDVDTDLNIFVIPREGVESIGRPLCPCCGQFCDPERGS
jgi:translation initiation factor 2 alpha subunit (eIF-2alpha)